MGLAHRNSVTTYLDRYPDMPRPMVNHQVVAMRSDIGTSATLAMHGHSAREERTIRIDGTRATVRDRFGAVQELALLDHRTGTVVPVGITADRSGHGGGDDGTLSSINES